jgi:16S rRNA (guanine1207-N2)-methyltransferase
MTTAKLKSDIVFNSELGGHELIFHSTWGLFSPKAIDEGTALLMQYLTVTPSDVVLDLGCGYGPLGLSIAKMAPDGLVHLIDKDFVAIEFTQKNIELNHIRNAQTYLSNGFDQVPSGLKFDVIVSNVPAKIGSELLSIFLNDAHDRLNPGGKLYIVTISGLKEYMKRNLTSVFGNYEKLKQSKTYTAALSVKNQNSEA